MDWLACMQQFEKIYLGAQEHFLAMPTFRRPTNSTYVSVCT